MSNYKKNNKSNISKSRKETTLPPARSSPARSSPVISSPVRSSPARSSPARSSNRRSQPAKNNKPNKKQNFQNISFNTSNIFGDAKLVMGESSYSFNDYNWLILIILLLIIYGIVRIFY